MTTSDDLHPTRWARTRPFASKFVSHWRDARKGSLREAAKSGDVNLIVMEVMALEVSTHGITTPFWNKAVTTGSSTLKTPENMERLDSRLSMGEVSLAKKAASWFLGGRIAYVLSDGLFEGLRRTDLSGVRLGDVRLPHDDFYVCLNGRTECSLPGPPNVVDGAYVQREGDGMRVTLTTRRTDGAWGHGDWPWSSDPFFEVPLTAPESGDPTFEELLDAAVASGDIDVVGDAHEGADDVSGFHAVAGRQVEVIDVRLRNDLREAAMRRDALPSVRQALSLVVNVIAWLSAKPDEVGAKGPWVSDAPRTLVKATAAGSRVARERAVADLLRGWFARTRILGADMAVRDPHGRVGDRHGLTESHWRRGHWRPQRHGPGLSLVKNVWIEPVIVRADLGEPPRGRIYDLGPVDAPPEPHDRTCENVTPPDPEVPGEST